MKLKIRNAKRKDCERIKEIAAQAWSGDRGIQEKIGADFSRFFYLIKKYAVAECNEKIVGYIKYTYFAMHGVINSIAIDSEYRGIGIGTKLCREALDKMKRAIIVEVVTGGDIKHEPARNMYETVGFEIQSRVGNRVVYTIYP